MRRRLASALGAALLLLVAQQGARAQSFSTSLPPDAKATIDRAEREMLDGDQVAAERDLETFVKLSPDFHLTGPGSSSAGAPAQTAVVSSFDSREKSVHGQEVEFQSPSLAEDEGLS